LKRKRTWFASKKGSLSGSIVLTVHFANFNPNGKAGDMSVISNFTPNCALAVATNLSCKRW
jgi:hypothetical protein